MPIDIRCSGCSRAYQIPDEHAGKKLKCKACGAVMVAPQEKVFEMTPLDDLADDAYRVSGEPPARSGGRSPAAPEPDLHAILRAMILECRQKLGPAPRTFEGEELAYFTLKPGLMCWLGMDRLGMQYRHQTRLRERGTVVWGHLVQANSNLFNRNDRGDYPADILYSPDSYYDGKPDELEAIAHGLFELKGTSPADRELRKFVAQITDELARPLQLTVPRAITGGRPVYMSALYIHRKHLPAGYLAQGLFPVLINLEETTTTMIVPSRFWSEALVESWNDS